MAVAGPAKIGKRAAWALILGCALVLAGGGGVNGSGVVDELLSSV